MLHQNKNKFSHQSMIEEDEPEIWMISYGDMITLLLSFFVIYFSTDFKKPQKEMLQNQLIMKLEEFKASPLGGTTDQSNIDENFDAIISKQGDRLILSFGDYAFFKLGEIDPIEKGARSLEEFAKKFIPFSGRYRIAIKAFTDKNPVLAFRRYRDNLELSALRAVSTMRILQKSGIPLNKMEIAGHGEMDRLSTLIDSRKIASLTDKEIQDLSRTVVLIIKPETEQSVL